MSNAIGMTGLELALWNTELALVVFCMYMFLGVLLYAVMKKELSESPSDNDDNAENMSVLSALSANVHRLDL